MAIAFVSATSGGDGPSATSLTVSHSLGSGSDRMVAGCVSIEGSDLVPSSVTFDGVAMTSRADATAAFDMARVYDMGEATLPAGGSSYDLVVNGVSGSVGASAVELTGVKDQAPEGSNTRTSDSGSTYSIGITTVTDDAWLVAAITQGSGNAHTSTSPAVERTEELVASGDTSHASVTHPGPGTAAADTVDGSWSGSKRNEQAVVAYEEAAAGGASIPIGPLTGPFGGPLMGKMFG